MTLSAAPVVVRRREGSAIPHWQILKAERDGGPQDDDAGKLASAFSASSGWKPNGPMPPL